MTKRLLTAAAAALVLSANVAYAHMTRPATTFACPSSCTSGYSCPGGCQCYGHIFNPSSHYCAAYL